MAKKKIQGIITFTRIKSKRNVNEQNERKKARSDR